MEANKETGIAFTSEEDKENQCVITRKAWHPKSPPLVTIWNAKDSIRKMEDFFAENNVSTKGYESLVFALSYADSELAFWMEKEGKKASLASWEDLKEQILREVAKREELNRRIKEYEETFKARKKEKRRKILNHLAFWRRFF